MGNCSASFKNYTKTQTFSENALKIDLEAQVVYLLKQSLSPREISRHLCDMGIPGVTPYREKKMLFNRASNSQIRTETFIRSRSECVDNTEKSHSRDSFPNRRTEPEATHFRIRNPWRPCRLFEDKTRRIDLDSGGIREV